MPDTPGHPGRGPWISTKAAVVRPERSIPSKVVGLEGETFESVLDHLSRHAALGQFCRHLREVDRADDGRVLTPS